MGLVSLEVELEQKSHQLMDKQKQVTTCKLWRIQGRGPGPAPPPLFVSDQTEARRAEKIFLGDRSYGGIQSRLLRD